jgi:hypothetical protein
MIFPILTGSVLVATYTQQGTAKTHVYLETAPLAINQATSLLLERIRSFRLD